MNELMKPLIEGFSNSSNKGNSVLETANNNNDDDDDDKESLIIAEMVITIPNCVDFSHLYKNRFNSSVFM